MGAAIKVHEALLNRKDKICHKEEIDGIMAEYNEKMGKINSENAIKYLSRHKNIQRIFKHYYYINSFDEKERKFRTYDDRELLFIVLNKLGIKWYVGLYSSLHLNGRIWQVPNILSIVSGKISGKRKILGLKVEFHKIRKSLIFGLKKGETKNKIPYFYSDSAKTYLDLRYFRIMKKIPSLKETKTYLKRYPGWLRG